MEHRRRQTNVKRIRGLDVADQECVQREQQWITIDRSWSPSYMPRKGNEIRGTSPHLTFTTKLKGERGNVELVHPQKSAANPGNYDKTTSKHRFLDIGITRQWIIQDVTEVEHEEHRWYMAKVHIPEKYVYVHITLFKIDKSGHWTTWTKLWRRQAMQNHREDVINENGMAPLTKSQLKLEMPLASKRELNRSVIVNNIPPPSCMTDPRTKTKAWPKSANMEQPLATHMEIAGRVYSVNIAYDQIIKENKTGCARVTYISRQAARNALQKLHGSTWAENEIGVSMATDKFEVTYNVGKIYERFQSIPHATREDLAHILKSSNLTQEEQNTCVDWLHQGHEITASRR